jgi:hypothetical protein
MYSLIIFFIGWLLKYILFLFFIFMPIEMCVETGDWVMEIPIMFP